MANVSKCRRPAAWTPLKKYRSTRRAACCNVLPRTSWNRRRPSEEDNHGTRTANQDPRHLHAWRHQQGRVFPRPGPARVGAGAGCCARCPAVAGDRQPRPLRQADRWHGRRLVEPARVPHNGVAVVRIWQANIGKTIIAHVPITDGAVQETGDFELDGVTFPAAEVQLEFMDPAAEEEGGGGSMFPTGNLIDDLEVPGIGTFKATLINAGIPTIFINAQDLGYTGTELQGAINGDPKALAMFETVRAYGALRMGLIKHLDEAAQRQHTPKVAFVAKPADYVASSGKAIKAGDIDLLVRALSMGKLHHAMMGTAAVAIGTAAAISGTLVNLAAGGVERNAVRFGHPSGTLRVGAEATQVNGEWVVKKAIMSRSARVLMEGFVRVPGDAF